MILLQTVVVVVVKISRVDRTVCLVRRGRVVVPFIRLLTIVVGLGTKIGLNVGILGLSILTVGETSFFCVISGNIFSDVSCLVIKKVAESGSFSSRTASLDGMS
jgi:hypothetical protein